MINDQFFQDSEVPIVAPTDQALSRVRDLVRRQQELEKLIDHLENELKVAKEDLIQVQENDLPTALQEYGLTSFTLNDGSRISIRQEYYSTIKDEHRGAAFSWLEDHGHADLIKHDVVMSFTKGQDEYAQAAMDLLKQNNLLYHDKKHVHPQTLRAFVREQIEAGKELPLDTFSVHVRQVARIQKEK